jgi:predicted DNA-binding protein YlxM (UPF0122 family)
MDDLEKTLYFNNLLTIYGNLLTITQKEILIDYYEANLSISEIAQNREVSRAAIEDAISKGNRKLIGFENELKMYEKQQNCLKIIAKIKLNTQNEEILKLLKELEDN